MIRMTPGYKCAIWLPIFLLVSGCEGLASGINKPEAVQQVVEQALKNQVFVEGGTFMLGDIGRPNGRPYVTPTDFSRPAICTPLSPKKLSSGCQPYSARTYENTFIPSLKRT